MPRSADNARPHAERPLAERPLAERPLAERPLAERLPPALFFSLALHVLAAFALLGLGRSGLIEEGAAPGEAAFFVSLAASAGDGADGAADDAAAGEARPAQTEQAQPEQEQAQPEPPQAERTQEMANMAAEPPQAEPLPPDQPEPFKPERPLKTATMAAKPQRAANKATGEPKPPPAGQGTGSADPSPAGQGGGSAAAAGSGAAGSAGTSLVGQGGGGAADHGAVKKRVRRFLVYNNQAKRLGIQGSATVAFTIERDGRALNIALVKTSGYALLDESALRAVRAASPFAPPAAPVRIVLPIDFSLK